MRRYYIITFTLLQYTVFTKPEYVALPSLWITEVVQTYLARHVVTVEPLPKIGELDGVLDEDRVVL